jgi:sulfate transport system substrate-binding protein
VDADVAKEVASKFPPVEDLWTIDDLGGWDKVLKDIYGPDGVWPRVFAEKSKPR